ncbi:MAG: cation:proton antiporter [Chloroflexi bacterium]|nr:cation:proton antiporter [Chloroflexota bacterium]
MPEAVEQGSLAIVRDFAIIMSVAGAAIVLFRRINQPPILGYLIAGLIVGPFTLPLMGLKSPVTSTETIRLLADLGLVILLFALGLEFGWRRIRQMGLRVIIIGVIEITLMMALGYEIGVLLGWNGTEAIFLGAALAISSSAILVKMLRDTSTLFTPAGRLIVGILVVEDLFAVVLLSILSSVATTGTTEIGNIGSIVAKLGLFLLSAAAIGALIAPRIINFVARFRSQEVMLIVGLALCFGLALVGESLGLSAAVGAFLIGTILGDTEHSEELTHIMNPVRDMFAALFFVSIGMLIDLSLVREFIVPALIVSAVFIVGKIVADTVGTFITGHDGRTSLHVGMGMPQVGEFSLAMIKVGADHAAIGAFLYPVVAVTTAITSLVYPFIFRSAGKVADFLDEKSPELVKHYVDHLSHWLISMRAVFSLQGEVADAVRRSGQVIIINFGIIVVLITVGTFVLRFTPEIAEFVRLQEGIFGLIVSGIVVALSIPPAVFIWRALQRLTDDVSDTILRRSAVSLRQWGRTNLRAILRDSILIVMVILLAIWSLPFVSQLLLLGSLAAPIPIALFVLVVALMWRRAFKIHRTLQSTFRQTFLGDSPATPPPQAQDNEDN